MASVINNKNEIIIPVLGIIFLAALFTIIISHFTKLDFGVWGIISWIIVIIGAAYFVLWALAQFF